MSALLAIIFVMELGQGIVSPILPDIKAHFGLSSSQAGLVVAAFALARLASDLPLGLLLDRVDRARLLALGTTLLMLGALSCGLAQQYPMLLVGRLAMGAGTALCMMTALFSISHGARAEARGGAIGIYQAVALAGITMSPAIGGTMASLAGWRAPFFFSAFTAATSLLGVVIASRWGKLSIRPTSRGRRPPTERPSEEGRAARIPWNVAAINYTTCVFFFSAAGFRNSVVPLHGGTALGIGAGTLGLMLGGSGMIRFLITLGSGFASDRVGRKAILIPGTFFLAAGTIGFALAGDLLGFALALVVLSFGGFGNSLPTTMLVDTTHPGRVGLAIGINRFLGDLGMLVGPVALGWVLDVAGFPTAAAVTAALLLSTVPGIVLTVRERRKGRKGREGRDEKEGTEGM